MPPQVTLAPQLCMCTFTSLMSTNRHPEHRLQIHEKSECFLMAAAPPSSGVLQKRSPPCHTAKKKRLEVPTILPEPPRPKDAKSVEKPGRRVILAAIEFFHKLILNAEYRLLQYRTKMKQWCGHCRLRGYSYEYAGSPCRLVVLGRAGPRRAVFSAPA